MYLSEIIKRDILCISEVAESKRMRGRENERDLKEGETERAKERGGAVFLFNLLSFICSPAPPWREGIRERVGKANQRLCHHMPLNWEANNPAQQSRQYVSS